MCSWIILILLFCNGGCGNNFGRLGNGCGCGNTYDGYGDCGCGGFGGQNNGGRGSGRSAMQNGCGCGGPDRQNDCGCGNSPAQNDCGCGNGNASDQNGNCGDSLIQPRQSREDFPSYGGNENDDCGCNNN